jgi:hypothetical protein
MLYNKETKQFIGDVPLNITSTIEGIEGECEFHHYENCPIDKPNTCGCSSIDMIEHGAYELGYCLDDIYTQSNLIMFNYNTKILKGKISSPEANEFLSELQKYCECRYKYYTRNKISDKESQIKFIANRINIDIDKLSTFIKSLK